MATQSNGFRCKWCGDQGTEGKIVWMASKRSQCCANCYEKRRRLKDLDCDDLLEKRDRALLMASMCDQELSGRAER